MFVPLMSRTPKSKQGVRGSGVGCGGIWVNLMASREVAGGVTCGGGWVVTAVASLVVGSGEVCCCSINFVVGQIFCTSRLTFADPRARTLKTTMDSAKKNYLVRLYLGIGHQHQHCDHNCGPQF